jgi:uncharacterized protein (TIGR03083 family)
MIDTPPFPELLELVAERSAAFREVVAAADDLGARVPGCPDWALRDLVAHLGAVHRFWAATVAAGPAAEPPSAAALGDREPHGDLIEWSAESTRMMLAALRAAGERDCWAWWGASGAPMTTGAVARHQVQETAVHTYDAQESIGRPEPLPASVAIDGIPEFLAVGLGSMGAWPHRPARIAVSAVEGPTWVVDLTPAGVRIDPAASGAPLATLRGSASDVVLTLYGRLPPETLAVDGDHAAARELLTWVKTE